MSRDMTDAPRPAVQSAVATDDGRSFLSRWSRRKLGREVDEPVPSAAALQTAATTAVAPDLEQLGPTGVDVPAVGDDASVAPAERIDARTGKPYSELTDADMPDLDTLDERSDLSMFLAGKVSQTLRMKALTKVFHSATYNQVCLCAEYAEDYTNFVPMGDIVPHDLEQAIAREAGKLMNRLSAQGLEITPEAARERVAAEFRGEPGARPAGYDQDDALFEHHNSDRLADGHAPAEEHVPEPLQYPPQARVATPAPSETR